MRRKYKSTGSEVLIGVLVVVLQCRSGLSTYNVLEFKEGCFADDTTSPIFTNVPSATNDEGGVASRCTLDCKDNGYKYSGLTDADACYCANEKPPGMADPAPCLLCKDGSMEYCGGDGDYVFIYRTVISRVAHMDVKILPGPYNMLQVVQVDYKQIYDNVNVRVMFGDNEQWTIWYNGTANVLEPHTYSLSGSYDVLVHGMDTNYPDPEDTAENEIDVTVLTPILKEPVLECPAVAMTDKEITCTLTILVGEDITVDIDFGDGLSPEVVDVADTPVEYVGIPIPQVPPEENIHMYAIGSPVTIIPRAVTLKGNLLFFEALLFDNKMDPDITFKVLRPECSSGKEICGDTGTCELVCPPECDGPVDLETGTCASSGGTSSIDIPKYTVLTSVKATKADIVGTPKFAWRLVRTWPVEVIQVLPGDAIGFETTSTQVYRNSSSLEAGDVAYNEQTKSGSHIMFNFFVGAVASSPTSMEFTHTYTESKTYVITAKLDSPTTSTSNQSTTSILLDTGIEGLSIQPEEEYAAANAVVYFTTSFEVGGEANMTVDYGDNSETESTRSTKKALVVLQHTYGYPGFYKVSVTANSHLSNTTNSCLVIIQRPVMLENWTMTLEQPKVVLPPGAVTVNLIFDGTTDQLPTNATAVFIWENGIEDGVTILIDHASQPTPAGVAQPFTNLHAYTSEGVYCILVNISNFISSISLNKTVEVIQGIKGVKVTLLHFLIPLTSQEGQDYTHKNKDTFLLPGTGLNKNAFPKKVVLVYAISHTKGRINDCELQWENGTTVAPPSNSYADPVIQTFFKNHTLYLARLYQEQGKYQQIVVCKNNVSNGSFPVPFQIMDGLDSLNITDLKSVTNISDPKAFFVGGDMTEDNVCIRIDFDDDCQTESYGNPPLCKQLFPDSQYISSFSLPQNFSHLYNDSNNYTLKVTAGNTENFVTRNITFQMMFLACDPAPYAHILIDMPTNVNMQPNNPSIRQRSKSVKILTDIGLDACKMNIRVNRRWQIVEVEPDGITEIRRVAIKEDLPSWNLSSLYVPQRFLDVGLYKINFSANVTPVRRDMKTMELKAIGPTFYTASLVYVKIKKSDLIPIMIAGLMTTVQRGRGQQVHLNPVGLSIDPDAPQEKNFTIEWACTTGKQKLQSWEMPPVKVLSKAEQSSSNTVNGGCFGTGNGPLDMRNGSWDLNTGDLLPNPTNHYYFISVRIRKDDRSGTVKLMLNITDPRPPSIQIQCRDQGLCFPTSDGVLINPTSRLALSSSCIEDCCKPMHYEEFTFKWVALGMVGAANWSLLRKDHIVGLNFDEIAIAPDFFQMHNGTQKFTFRLTASCGTTTYNKENLSGSAGITVALNKPPEMKEACTIESTNEFKDTALKSKFRITCSGWSDPEGGGIRAYRFFVTKQNKFTNGPEENSDWQSILCDSRVPFCDTVLPCGTVELFVTVEDMMRATTTQFITNKTLIPPDDIREYTTSSEWLETLRANGNQFAMLQTFQALSSVQECSDKYKDDVEDSIATMKKLLDSMREVNLDTYEDALLYTSSLGSFLMDGSVIDSNAKETIVGLLARVENCMKNNADRTPLEPLKALMKNTVEIMGVLAGVGTKTIMEGKVLPTDQRAAETMDYDADLQDTNMDEKLTMEQLLQRAIIDKEKRQTRLQLERLDSMMNGMAQRLLNLIVVDEPPLQFNSPLSSSIYVKFRYNNISRRTFEFGDSKFELVDVKQLLNDTGMKEDEPVAVSAVEWNFILKSTGKNLDLVSPKTKSLQINMYNAKDTYHVSKVHVPKVTKPFDIFIPQRESETEFQDVQNKTRPPVTYTQPTMKWYEQMAYHQAFVNKTGAAMIIGITLRPNDSDARLLLYVKYKKKPLIDSYDFFFKLYEMETKNNSYNIFLDTEVLKGNIGAYYIGIAQLRDNKSVPIDSNATRDMIQNITIAYKASLIGTGCYYYDDYLNDWKGHGCYVNAVTETFTHCKCTHLTTFAGGLMVVPNKIDFDYVFAHASFADNLTIYATIILTLVLFIIFLIWARRKDNRDRLKIGALPLPDNQPQAKYLYEILVFTGHDRKASCDSKVSFVLSGDKEETEVRTFGTPPRKVFRRDGVDVFIMTTPRPLGQLQYLRIWHDSSGEGSFGSWHLDYVIFRDVQTGEKFEFIGNCWLALERDDGETDRMLPVAGKEQLTEFNHLFGTSSRKNLADGHLWFSVFLRPPRSRFTRCQRVSCCVALLYLSMLVNAMWYGTVPEKPAGDALKMGPLSISLEQVSVGFFSNLIVFPPSFLIIFIFRKSRPRKLRPSRVDEALKKQRESCEASKTKSAFGKKKTQAEKDRINQLYQRKKRFSLPWWCAIIAWILCIACILLSIFFLWAYGITFGDSKTKKWITSLIISFFLSILFIQPIKVFFFAIIFSSLCKKVETDEDDADEDELDPNLEYDEEWPQGDPTIPQKIAVKPKDPAEVEQLRLKRMQEVKLWQIIREIFGYLIFLWILSIVTVSVRDPNAFHLRNGILDEFVNQGKPYYDFLEINDFEHFQSWMTHIMIPRLRPGTFYNGQTRVGWVGYTEFGVNRILGKAILRQIRSRSDGYCQYNHVMDMYNISCRRTHVTKMTMAEDDVSYMPGWKPLNGEVPSGRNHFDFLDTYKPFIYSTSEEYKTTMLIGNLDIYSGNGYVFELSRMNLVSRFKSLLNSSWIDSFTRAVTVEFSVYNAQVDLFCIVKLLLEVGPGGGLHPYIRINPVRLLSADQGLGNLYLVCQLIFVIYIIYYTVRELFQMCSKGRKYFKEFWNSMELLVVLMAWAAIGTYIARFFILRNVMKVARKTNYVEPVDLPHAQIVDEMFSYLIAGTMYLSIIKLNKLLRFNNRLTTLAQTISQCLSDLGGFFILLVILFIAFGTLFHFSFKDLVDCKSMYGALTTLFSITLNKFDFDEYLKEQPIVGPIIFFTFSFLFSIVIMNVFLSILIGSFERVKKDIHRRPAELHMMNFLVGRMKGMFGIGAGRKRVKPKITEKDTEKEEINGATAELPEKVDKLLDYINDVYFDGKLDMSNKKLLRGNKHGILKSD